MRLAHDGGTPLLHRLKQSGLRLRRGAVDLVSKNNVGEKRAGLENETAHTVDLLKERIARDVTRQKVRGKLHALGLERQGFRKALHQFRFAKAGKSLKEQVAPGDKARDNKPDELFLSEEDVSQGILQFPELPGSGLKFFCAGIGAGSFGRYGLVDRHW